MQPPPIEPGNLAPQARLAIHQTFSEGFEFPGFDTRGTSDPEGEPLRYFWDFGDGSTGTDEQATHTYVDNGSYVVTLIVTDPHNAADTATAVMTITNLAPYINAVSLSLPPMPASIPTQAVVHVDYIEYGANDKPSLTLAWGDGTISQDTIHSYTVPGVYAVSATVTDKDGASATHTGSNPIWLYDPAQDHATAPGYDAIDLGNLGANAAQPWSLNNRGQIVGYSVTWDSLYHAFIWENGLMRDIGASLSGATRAQVINDAGWVAGSSSNEGGNGLAIWRNGALTTVRTGGEENGAWAVAVDDAGAVLLNIFGHEFGSAAIWRNGELIRLGGLGTGYADAADINTQGQVVGSSAFRYVGAASYAYHAFLWENGVMKDLGDLGYGCDDADPYEHCGHSAAFAINERGQIVGEARAPSGLTRAAIWEPGATVAKDLGFGTGTSRAVAINERGEIAGDSRKPDYHPDEGFFRDDDGTITNLGSLGGGGTQVVAMNESGIIVGTSKTAAGATHPFVWRRETGMVDLGVGPYGANGVGAFATGLNDRGDVIGYALPCRTLSNGECYYSTYGEPMRAILWRNTTPAPVSTARRSGR